MIDVKGVRSSCETRTEEFVLGPLRLLLGAAALRVVADLIGDR
jgi:hypothetical protein